MGAKLRTDCETHSQPRVGRSALRSRDGRRAMQHMRDVTWVLSVAAGRYLEWPAGRSVARHNTEVQLLRGHRPQSRVLVP
jgi:hypothetical protein